MWPLQKSKRFQFHSGSIKSLEFFMPMRRKKRFQFHSGSIKRIHVVARVIHVLVFQFHSGSIKRHGRKQVFARGVKFQFHSGSIKREMAIMRSDTTCVSFNSIVVRLKAGSPVAYYSIATCFNSIVVRLKGDWCSTYPFRFVMFQFHSGSIKSWGSGNGDRGSTRVSIP